MVIHYWHFLYGLVHYEACIVLTVHMGPSTPLEVKEDKLVAGLRLVLSWCVKELVQSMHSPEEVVENEHQTKVNDA